MKRTIAFLMAVAMILTLVPMTAFAAESITVTAADKDFTVGESITTANFTVTYKDDAEEYKLTSKDFTINDKSSVSFSKPGTQTLTIKYKSKTDRELTAKIDVYIHAASDSIEAKLSAAGAARTFVQGDTVSAADFVVDYFKADAVTAEKTLAAEEFTVSPTTLANAGDNTVTITYGSLKTSVTISGVIAKSEPKLVISGSAKTEYYVGDFFSTAGLTFYFQPRNKTSEDQKEVTGVVNNDATAAFDSLGEKTITFTYYDADSNETVSATLKVNVVPKLKSIKFTGEKKIFYAGDTFDPTGLTATVYANDGSVATTHEFTKETDDSDFSWSNDPLKAGQNSIAITYLDDQTGEKLTADVEITVLSKYTKIEHTAGDIKTYYIGEAFDPTGLTFTVYTTDNTVKSFAIYGQTVAAYDKLTWTTDTFTEAGNKKITVTFTDALTGESVSTDITVVVKNPQEAKIQAATKKENLQVVVGDDFNPDDLFEVTFQAANTVGFNKLSYANNEYTISPAIASFSAEGVQTFTVSKDGVSTTVSVEVLPVIKNMTVSGVGSLDLYGGDEFDPAGLTVTVVYNKGTLWTEAKPDYTALPTDLSWSSDTLVAGEKTLALTFTDPTTQAKATQDITFTVKNLLKGITVTNPANQPIYADDPFTTEGLSVAIETNNGSQIIFVDEPMQGDDVTTYITDADLTYDRTTDLTAGTGKSITISYTHKASGETVSTTFKFDVAAAQYTAAAEDGNPGNGPKRRTYTEGETFDPSGLSWNLMKNGTTPITVTTGFKIYPDRELTPADTYVTVVYGNLAYVYDITVTERTLVSIEVTQGPDLASFYVGQRFDPEGMIVTATYNNKTTSEVSEFTYDSAVFTESDIGKKDITITYKEGAVTATTTYTTEIVAAPIRAASLVLSKSTLSLVETKEETISATVYPANATNKSLVWTSTNTAVARVDQAGKITAVGAGACVITATTTDGSNRYADCYVVVDPKVDVSKLVLKASTMELLVGDTTTLTATIQPDNATYNVANWTTSNPDVVTVDENGQIKGVKLGSATITASADGVEASIKISVVKELTKYGTVVNCSRRVNVRKSPDGGAKQVGYAYLGTTYVVTGETGNWYQIQYNGGTAYIWKDYIELAEKSYVSDSENTSGDSTTDSSTGNDTTVTVYTTLKVVNCKRYVYVRKGPSTATSKAGHAKPGETYKLLGQSGSWYIIEYNGTQAYISSQFGQLS